ncbi:hypothetical protein JB92DRAFT_2762048, partial [Gautieria morchelliformis]
NGEAAQRLNAAFAKNKIGDTCQTGEQACVSTNFVQCVNGRFQESVPCGRGTRCLAVPLRTFEGTTLGCKADVDVAALIASTGAQGGLTGSG